MKGVDSTIMYEKAVRNFYREERRDYPVSSIKFCFPSVGSVMLLFRKHHATET